MKIRYFNILLIDMYMQALEKGIVLTKKLVVS